METLKERLVNECSAYFGGVPKDEASFFLKPDIDGVFYIRDSSCGAGFAIVERCGNRIRRYIILYDSSANLFQIKVGERIGSTKNFMTLSEALDSLRESCGDPTKFTLVAEKPTLSINQPYQISNLGITLEEKAKVKFIAWRRDYIICATIDGKRIHLPRKILNFASSCQISDSYRKLCPTNARAKCSRQASLFDERFLSFMKDDEFIVRCIEPTGFCFATHVISEKTGHIVSRALRAGVGSLRITPGTAILHCDMQEKFRPTIAHFDAIVNVASRVFAAGKLLGIRQVVTEMYPKGLGPTVPELGDLTGMPVYEKQKFSMLTDEVLRWLDTPMHGDKVDRVLLCGIEAHVCVQSTALDLVERGIEVHCLADACSSRSMVDRRYAFKRMRQSGVYITTCESALLGLLCGADHPNFRQVQKLIMASSPDSGL